MNGILNILLLIGQSERCVSSIVFLSFCCFYGVCFYPVFSWTCKARKEGRAVTVEAVLSALIDSIINPEHLKKSCATLSEVSSFKSL